MPTYGYKCTKCENTFEVFQKVNDSPITTCSKCGGPTRKVFYPVGIIFKGPGFHINDYRRPKESEQDKGKMSESKQKASSKKEPSKKTTEEKVEKAS